MADLLLAVVVGQLWVTVLNRVLSELPAGSVSGFAYAMKISILLAMPAAAIITVLFPAIAEEWQTGDSKRFAQVCTRTLRVGLFLALPTVTICIVFRDSLVTLIFKRGAFSQMRCDWVSNIFMVLLIAGPASVLNIYLQKIMYAVQDVWIPTITQLMTGILIVACAPYVSRQFGIMGVAGLYACTLWLTTIVFVATLVWRHRALRTSELISVALQTSVLVVGEAWLGHFATLSIPLHSAHESTKAFAVVTLGGGLSFVIYYACSLIARLPEAEKSREYLKWQSIAIGRKFAASLGNGF